MLGNAQPGLTSPAGSFSAREAAAGRGRPPPHLPRSPNSCRGLVLRSRRKFLHTKGGASLLFLLGQGNSKLSEMSMLQPSGRSPKDATTNPVKRRQGYKSAGMFVSAPLLDISSWLLSSFVGRQTVALGPRPSWATLSTTQGWALRCSACHDELKGRVRNLSTPSVILEQEGLAH